MNKISKLLVMAVVVLAVITMSLNVHAGTEELKGYVGGIHNINNMVFELTDSQKTAVFKYIETLDNATADAIYKDIKAAEKVVAETGATNISQMSASSKKEVINLAASAAKKAGLTLKVNTANNTFSLRKANGDVLVSGSADALIKYQKAPNGTSTPAASTGKLLYTGANYAVYAVSAVAIVAVAIVVKKRA